MHSSEIPMIHIYNITLGSKLSSDKRKHRSLLLRFSLMQENNFVLSVLGARLWILRPASGVLESSRHCLAMGAYPRNVRTLLELTPSVRTSHDNPIH